MDQNKKLKEGKGEGILYQGKQSVSSKEGTSGITLVALVVTIVVLLILAGITIMYVMGDNSVFKQASEAKLKTDIANYQERLEMAKNPNLIEGLGTFDPDKYFDYIQQQGIINNKDTDVIDNEDGTYYVTTKPGYVFLIKLSPSKANSRDAEIEYLGQIGSLVSPKVTISEVTLSEDAKSATFTITAKEETKGINRIEIWLSGVKLETIQGNNETTVTKPYTVYQNGTYTIKAYADLSTSAEAKVTGVIPIVAFIPNENKTYKKEHTTKIETSNVSETIRSIKYKWSATKPEEGDFITECPNDKVITGSNMTGTYYLWILLETGEETVKKYIYGSGEFYFDNIVPTAEIKTDWIEEETRNRLKIFINTSDEHSKIDDNSIKLYVTPENGTKEEKDIKLTSGTGEIIVDGLNMESVTKIELSILDNAQNSTLINKNTGRVIVVKNGKIGNCTVGTPEYCSYNEECDDGSGNKYLLATIGINGWYINAIHFDLGKSFGTSYDIHYDVRYERYGETQIWINVAGSPYGRLNVDSIRNNWDPDGSHRVSFFRGVYKPEERFSNSETSFNHGDSRYVELGFSPPVGDAMGMLDLRNL